MQMENTSLGKLPLIFNWPLAHGVFQLERAIKFKKKKKKKLYFE